MTVTLDSQDTVVAAEPVVSTDNAPEWEITFQGTINVHAQSIDQALTEARKLGVVKRIVGINLKR